MSDGELEKAFAALFAESSFVKLDDALAALFPKIPPGSYGYDRVRQRVYSLAMLLVSRGALDGNDDGDFWLATTDLSTLTIRN